jgi:four helix bundle protein
MHNFKNLKVWNEAMKFCVALYLYTRTLPVREKFNLVSQLEKCAVSIPSNIAEGSGKRTNTHFAEFLTTPMTSAFECETQLPVCQSLGYGDQNQLEILLSDVVSLQRRIHSFRKTLGYLIVE